MGVKTDGTRKSKKFDDINSPLAGFDPRNPRLIFPHPLRQIALAQVSGLPLADQKAH